MSENKKDIVFQRYELAKDRIQGLPREMVETVYADYINRIASLFVTIEEVLDTEAGGQEYVTWNRKLYADIRGDAYEKSYANPAYTAEIFGKKTGQYLCWYYTRCRDAIVAAFEKDRYEVVLCMELFLQEAEALEEEEEPWHSLKENMYYYIHDYDEERLEKNIRRMLVPDENGLLFKIIMKSDFFDTSYLYHYGECVTENEIRMAEFLASLPEEELSAMARTYTEGFRQGFLAAGIDLSKKSTVQIRYHIGFEPMVRQAVLQFREMGLEPVFTRQSNTKSTGVVSTPPNKQYLYDHRYDEALYVNHALLQERRKKAERVFEKYKREALQYAGPAVIETFGEDLFAPETKEDNPVFDGEQEMLWVNYTRDFALLQNRYIPQDEYSFTIIAYPIPEIGPEFSQIFQETVKVNTLDTEKYREIQQKLIDALDQGDFVHVTGRGDNHTDIVVKLHPLVDAAHQTNFENCLADVNIPLGEVFTSPLLHGTEGVLHVTSVYLNQLRYENLEFTFENGMVCGYNCSNYESEKENKQYIRQNIMKNRDTLPIGEFAIGTNTTAYVMGRRYNIEEKLPILIAEKTGPHFALGDTCYSMSEDVVLHNPDGKEIIAKDNECSAQRNTDISKAYFNCHTDITIPYDELGDINVHTMDGEVIPLIQNGRFVLSGTESLNDILQ